jgi:hypothetical protein
MPSQPHLDDRAAEFTFPVKLAHDRDAIEKHLGEVLSGEAFRGSTRSGQFLRYIIEETVSGRQANLKERLLGIEIFGRSPSYDTSEDAIVRVTANDVRKRLQQHYTLPGKTGTFRFSLPPGSYVPKIIREKPAGVAAPSETVPTTAAIPSPPPPASNSSAPVNLQPQRFRGWAAIAGVLLCLNVGLCVALWEHMQTSVNPLASMPPWSVILSGPNPPLVITSDPNIAEIQGFTGAPTSLSDYANHKYVPHPERLTPEQIHFCNVILRGDKASTVDTPIVANVAAIAAIRSKEIAVRGARMIQLADLQGDKNVIVLGSLRSNPWVNLFNNHMDFRFEFEPSTQNEIIRNVHARPGERATYIATAPGWATGESYALIALAHNPDGNGRVLLIAGENGEGTEAAGRLLNDVPRLRETLAKCGSHLKDQNFEILLHLNTLAGSPSNVDTVACHII